MVRYVVFVRVLSIRFWMRFGFGRGDVALLLERLDGSENLLALLPRRSYRCAHSAGSRPSTSLESGAYVAEANATFANTSAGPRDANCDLRFDRSGPPTFIDFLDLTLGGSGEPAQWQNAHLAGAFELLPGDGPLRVSCLAQGAFQRPAIGRAIRERPCKAPFLWRRPAPRSCCIVASCLKRRSHDE